MKKIIIIMCALLFIIPACNKSNDNNNSDSGYDTFTFSNDLTVLSGKLYSFSHASMNYFCGPDASCVAVIYSETIDEVDYVGIAAKYKNPDLPAGQSSNSDYAANSFKLMIYWSGSAFTEGSIIKTTSEYTIKIIKPGAVYSIPGGNLNIDIAISSAGYYSINFNAPLTVQNAANPADTVTINSGDTIQAPKY